MPKSSAMWREVAPGVLQWSRFSPERQVDLNGLFIVDETGNVAIDPPALDAMQLSEMRRQGGVAHVVLTNRDHARKAADLVEHMRARVHAHHADAPALPFPVHHTFTGGQVLPAGLVAIEIPGSKCPGECAFLLPRDGGTLILGEAHIGLRSGRLSLLPDAGLGDPLLAREGLRLLLAHSYERVLVSAGTCPPARAALETVLAHLPPPRRSAPSASR